MDRNRLLSPREIQGFVAEGELIVVYEGNALKLNGWIDKHPGGRLAIMHMVGRDATDEINVYHFAKTLAVMKAYRIGRVQLPWTNLIPPIRVTEGQQETLILPEISVEAPQDKDLSSDTSSEAASIFDERGCTPSSQTSSVVSSKEDLGSVSPLRRRTSAGEIAAPVKSTCAEKLSRAAFTAAMEQKEVTDDIRSYPSLDLETQEAIREEYEQLHQKIRSLGYYACPYLEYGKEMIRCSILFGTFLTLLNKEWYLTSACFLGLFWQQIMFVAHDAGHRGITGNFIIDTLIGAFVADFCCGLSIGWWKSSHNVHHLVPNHPEHDPDIQNVPLFATSPSYFKSLRSTFYNFTFVWDRAADILVPYQKYTYYPVMGIARFNLYLLSWLHLASPRAAQLGSAWWTRWVEVAFMGCFWYIFGYRLLLQTLPDWYTRVAFVLISHIITMVLHVQITLSHWGMSTADLGPTESFAQRQLRTTMDIDCPAWLDFFHGGLQFQAVHHLFPRVPRHNLRKCQPLVREFCKKTGLTYNCHGFVEGNKIMLSRLEEISQMVETLVECQSYMAETGESGLH